MENMTFYLYWNLIASEFGMDEATSKKWLDIVVAKYNEPGRFYHTLEHISNCLEVTELLDYRFGPDDVLPLLFHDIVYDTKSKTNEEDSYIFCSNFLKEVNKTVNPITYKLYYIGLTKHNENSRIQAKNNRELAYFLDVDLSILGAPDNKYDEYASNVKKEYLYGGVGVSDYNVGRYKFLDSMLKIDTIFHTEEVRGVLETQARKNIEREMKLYE